jgi:hypothetical protein
MSENILKENTGISRKMILWACDNGNNVSATYSNFLTTLAGFFLTLSPLVLKKEIINNSIALKIFLALAIFLIFLSLIFGGIYIFLKKKFFSKWVDNYSEIFKNWNTCKEEDVEKAIACEECIYLKNKTESSQWPLYAQTILLLLGISILISIVIIKIFSF